MLIQDFGSDRRLFLRVCGASTAAIAMSGLTGCFGGRVAALSSLVSENGILPLNFNENSLGMSPRALEAALAVTRESSNRYVFNEVKVFKQALADLHQVETDQIILGNGSTEVIQAVVALAEEQNAAVIEPTPTFGDVARYSRAEGLDVINVPVGDGFEIDIAALKQAAQAVSGSKLINVCNPNNPTGSIVPFSVLAEWIQNAPDDHLFLLDEAYFDYAQQNPRYGSGLALIREGLENVLITRTFSKVYGMAGLRVGYGVAGSKLAKKVAQFSAGFNMNAPGVAAALASLKDNEFYAKSIESNRIGKAILTDALSQLGLEYVPSNTNFVLHRIGSNLSEYTKRMADRGVKVGRKMTEQNDWNRLSIGTPAQMNAFVKILFGFRERGWV